MSFLRQLLILAVLAGLGYGGYLAYQHYGLPGPGENKTANQQGGPRAVPVEIGRAEITRIETKVEAVGTSRALQSVEIVPQASGRIAEFDIEPGAAISAGEVIARLDDDIARADLAEAEAKATDAAKALERSLALRRNKTVSEAAIQTLEANAAVAAANLERAKRRLADRVVAAPFAGIVGLRRVDAGAQVDTDTVLTTLDDLSEIEIEFAVPELLYGQVKPGTPVAATAAAFAGRVFSGTVSSIDSRIDATARSFKVRARIPNADFALPAGMFMHLGVVLDTRDGLTVPETALMVQGAESFVFAISEGKAVRKPVKIGVRRVGTVEVLQGIGEGETIAVSGLQRLRDGAEVNVVNRPVTSEPAAPGSGS